MGNTIGAYRRYIIKSVISPPPFLLSSILLFLFLIPPPPPQPPLPIPFTIFTLFPLQCSGIPWCIQWLYCMVERHRTQDSERWPPQTGGRGTENWTHISPGKSWPRTQSFIPACVTGSITPACVTGSITPACVTGSVTPAYVSGSNKPHPCTKGPPSPLCAFMSDLFSFSCRV